MLIGFLIRNLNFFISFSLIPSQPSPHFNLVVCGRIWGMEIPYQQLEPETLRNIIEEFVLREGTDYGHADIPLDKKINDVMMLLKSGEIILTYDEATKSCNLIPN